MMYIVVVACVSIKIVASGTTPPSIREAGAASVRAPALPPDRLGGRAELQRYWAETEHA